MMSQRLVQRQELCKKIHPTPFFPDDPFFGLARNIVDIQTGDIAYT